MSPLLSFWTAGRVFGLPVSQKSTVTKDRIFAPKDFCANSDTSSSIIRINCENVRDQPRSERIAATNDVESEGLLPVPTNESRRPHLRLFLISALLSFCQLAIFLGLLFAMPHIQYIGFIWVCGPFAGIMYVVWLLVSFIG
jgi:hypothetical protein